MFRDNSMTWQDFKKYTLKGAMTGLIVAAGAHSFFSLVNRQTSDTYDFDFLTWLQWYGTSIILPGIGVGSLLGCRHRFNHRRVINEQENNQINGEINNEELLHPHQRIYLKFLENNPEYVQPEMMEELGEIMCPIMRKLVKINEPVCISYTYQGYSYHSVYEYKTIQLLLDKSTLDPFTNIDLLDPEARVSNFSLSFDIPPSNRINKAIKIKLETDENELPDFKFFSSKELKKAPKMMKETEQSFLTTNCLRTN